MSSKLRSPEPDKEAMTLRLLAALEKRDRGEVLDERERRICEMMDASWNCASCAAKAPPVSRR